MREQMNEQISEKKGEKREQRVWNSDWKNKLKNMWFFSGGHFVEIPKQKQKNPLKFLPKFPLTNPYVIFQISTYGSTDKFFQLCT